MPELIMIFIVLLMMVGVPLAIVGLVLFLVKRSNKPPLPMPPSPPPPLPPEN